jgi:hypothetical protein
MFFYTFKGALNRTTTKLYSMANIERAIKAALAKRGLEYSLKDETLYLGHCIKVVKMFWSFCQHSTEHHGLIMANIKIFQLLPDVYDMLLGVVTIKFYCDGH